MTFWEDYFAGKNCGKTGLSMSPKLRYNWRHEKEILLVAAGCCDRFSIECGGGRSLAVDFAFCARQLAFALEDRKSVV